MSTPEEEMHRRRVEVLGLYGNMEYGRVPHQRDARSPYLRPALHGVKETGEAMTREERDAEIKRLQAARDHASKMIGRCILLGAAVLFGGMFLVMIMAMLGI